MTQPILKRAWTWLEHVPSLFLAATGLAILVIDVFFHTELAETALFKEFPDYVPVVFVVFMTIGAICCTWGVLTKAVRVEGAGIILVGSAYILDAIAILAGGTGLFTGVMVLSAGLYLWFQAFVLFPARDYPSNP